MAKADLNSRRAAGRLLGQQLVALLGMTDGKTHDRKPLVFAVPKGGLPVAREISEALNAPLDVVPERRVESKESLEFSSVTADQTRSQISGYDDISDNTVIIADDLIANGAAAVAAIESFSKHGATRIIVATPLISTAAMERLLAFENVEVCSVYVLEETPSIVDLYKDDDEYVSDDEIRAISTEARKSQTEVGESETEWVDIHISEGTQVARWRAPKTIRGVVMIVNTHGDFHKSARVVEEVAEKLETAGIGLLSLTLTEFVGDVASLSQRIRHLTDWLESFPPAQGLPVAYFGLGLGGAAMVEAAAATPEKIKAIVCYEAPLGDIADFIPRVHAPTLLVLENDVSENREANRKAFEGILVEKSLCVLSHAAGIGEAIEPWIERFLGSSVFKKSRASVVAERPLNF